MAQRATLSTLYSSPCMPSYHRKHGNIAFGEMETLVIVNILSMRTPLLAAVYTVD
jgi:hypothetical protein